MPRSMNMGKYPAVFSQIMRHFASFNPQPIVIELESETKATLIRFQFYSFEKAVRRAGRVEDAQVLSKIMVKKRGRTLEFLDRDLDPDYADITRQVMGQIGGGGTEMDFGNSNSAVPAKSEEEVIRNIFGLSGEPNGEPNGELTQEEIDQASPEELMRREMLGE